MPKPVNKPALPLQDRLALYALQLNEQAQALRPGPERDAMMRRARHAETASHLYDRLLSPELKAGGQLVRLIKRF
jgi:hypothetical protein